LARLQSAGHGLVDVIDRTLFVLVGGWLIRNSGVSAGAFLALTLYRETMVASLDALRTIRITVGSARGSAARLEDIVDAKTLALPVGSETPGIITSGKVSIRELSYRYSLFSEWIFSNFSLEVRDGENIAIVAPSGSGKTTLAKLICGALKPCRGQVVVGDVDVHDTGGEMALRAIGTVMQDDALCAGSIRENIEMFRGLSQQDIEAAARVAELHDWVQSLPMRYETDISDSVTTLSGGQRQRILIARAICGSARLLVMDEATSHLDVATEHAILDRVRKLGVTTITFAHRPETIRRADRIIDLQRDRIGNQEAA
jgi:ATP-binding cassette subfamily B protein RaxB